MRFCGFFWKKQKNAGKRSEWKRDHFDKPHQVNLTDDLIILKIEMQRPSIIETSPRWGFSTRFPAKPHRAWSFATKNNANW